MISTGITRLVARACLLFWLCISLTAAEADNKKPLMLQGGIEHSATMTPVEEDLRTGTSYDTNTLSRLTANNIWYQIPSWLAGYWKSERDDILSVHNYLKDTTDNTRHSQEQKFHEQWGYMKDARGNVWDYAATPYTIVFESGDHLFIQYVSVKEPVKIAGDMAVIRFINTCQNVNRHTRIVADTFQIEAIQTYEKLPDGSLICDISTKKFDQNGNPVELVHRRSLRMRLEPFADINQYDGRDMRKLFAEYLSVHGLSNLIPGGR